MVHTNWRRKILRKKLSARDENRHLDIKREVNFRMTALIKRYSEQYVSKKKSEDREKSILDGIREELGSLFVREVDGAAVQRWYGVSPRAERALGGNGGTALQRHAPHDGEGGYDLEQRKPALTETPLMPCRGEAARRSAGAVPGGARKSRD
jgi:hypothetical protein